MSASASTIPKGAATNANEDFKYIENQIVAVDRKKRAQIHLLPSELLSSIFELCSWNDWKSPLRIGCVCANWRYVILKTPRVWCSIVIDKNKPLEEAYFERSGHCGLHVRCPFGSLLPIDIIDRIECMHHEVFDHVDFFSHRFPRLERLSIKGGTLSNTPYALGTSSFPTLRHLDALDTRFSVNMDCSSIPELESVSLLVLGGNNTWLAIVQGCIASLTSLSLNINSAISNHSLVAIKLPKLYYLNVKSPYGCDMSWLTISAPALRVYIAGGSPESRCNIANGLQLVTHLRLAELRSLHSLSNIRVLQTWSSIPVYRALLQELMDDPVHLPYFQGIQFFIKTWSELDESEKFVHEVDQWNEQHNSPVHLSYLREWKKEPPWDSNFPVRLHTVLESVLTIPSVEMKAHVTPVE